MVSTQVYVMERKTFIGLGSDDMTRRGRIGE
jgi:hypothetical protein